ncbi:MAG: Nramp family divalent metal transporter [Micrococcales bacterium]
MKPTKALRGASLLGPAIVAGVAYLDPGNVATNLSAGAGYGFLLTWVIVLATLTAWLVQYLSAKLGLVTGRTVPELLGERLGSKSKRVLFWLQAQVVAIATDVAEVIGGAIALNLLFDLPLLLGGLITGAISMALLAVQSRGWLRVFEVVILGLILVTGVGFFAALVIAPPSGSAIAAGLVPLFGDSGSIVLAAGMVGATIMPHAIYAHSALSRDRFKHFLNTDNLARLIRATKWDVSIAMVIAGSINLAILFMAATSLFGVEMQNSIYTAYLALNADLGHTVAVLFAFGLLASGLASTSVGTYAGGVITSGLMGQKLPPMLLRGLTLIPALAVIALASDATSALVYSQVLLSFGIPFALFPLVRLTSDARLMGSNANGSVTRLLGYAVAGVISALNVWVIATAFFG